MTSDHQYKLRKLAEQDLELIWQYGLARWGRELADNYLNALFDRIEWLASQPLIGRKRDDIKQGYYSFPEGVHIIFYLITDNQLDILGIPHQSMDQFHHLD